MEDNNVNNTILNNESEISPQLTKLLDLAVSRVDFADGGGGGGGSTSSSGNQTSGGSSSSDGNQISSGNTSQVGLLSNNSDLTPILLILDNGEIPEPTPDDDEEPVLLEEDDNTKYKLLKEDESTLTYAPIFDSRGTTSIVSRDFLIGITENNELVDLDKSEINISYDNNSTWCSVILKRASDSTIKSYFSQFGDIDNIDGLNKIWVPDLSVEKNDTNDPRNTTITFKIKNSNIINLIISQKAGSSEISTPKKYSIYMIFELPIDYNSILPIFETYSINRVGVLTGKQSDFTNNKITGVSSLNSDYLYLYKHSLYGFGGDSYDFTANDGYVSGLMYANHISYDLDLCDKSDMQNYYESLYNFILSINETDRKISYTDFLTTSLPSEYLKNIKDLLSNNYNNYFIAKYTDPDADIYAGEKIEFMPNWTLYCTTDKQPSLTYCPIPIVSNAMGSGYTNTFYGLTSNTIYNINTLNSNKTSLIEHCFIYNETDNKIAYDYNWTNWNNDLTPCLLYRFTSNTFKLYTNGAATLYNTSSTGIDAYIYSISSDSAVLYFGLKDVNNNFEGKLDSDLTKYISKFSFSASDISIKLAYNNIGSKEGISALFMISYKNLNAIRTITVNYDGKYFFTLNLKNKG